MLVSSFCASRLSDTTCRMSATELVLRSPIAAALQPSTRMALSTPRPSSRCCHASLHEVLLAAPQRGTRRHLKEGRELLLSRSISSVAAASDPSQQHQIRRNSSSATAVSRDDDSRRGLFLFPDSRPVRASFLSGVSPLPGSRPRLSMYAAPDMGPFSGAYAAGFFSLAEKSSLEKNLGPFSCHKNTSFCMTCTYTIQILYIL